MADKKKRGEALYGSNFPGWKLPDKFPKKTGWKEWLNSRFDEQKSPMEAKRLHWARHRHFRAGRQWISSRDGVMWRELRHDENVLRAVLNVVSPALDYRLGVLREQRPGFQVTPHNNTPKGRESAEARQIVAEYNFNELKTHMVLEQAAAAAQTDGTAFIHIYKDKGLGEKKRRQRRVVDGGEGWEEAKEAGFEPGDDGDIIVGLDEDGEDLGPGEQGAEFATGGIGQRVIEAHMCLADPEAKTLNGPVDAAKWFIVRRPRKIEAARAETGIEDLSPDSTDRASDPFDLDTTAPQWTRGLPSYPHTRLKNEECIYEYIIWFNAGVHPDLPKGGWRKVMGDQLISGENKLPGGKIPLAQITDGSPDSDLFPRPVMSDWIGDQVCINSLVSMLLAHARMLGAGRIIAQKDSILEETFTALGAALTEYQGVKPEFMTPPKAGSDVWDMLNFFIGRFEDKSGWNALARGQVTGSGSFQDVSGRAVLGARELFERSLAPMIRAAADGMTEWADLIITYSREVYDGPRLIPIVGGRRDLARLIDREMLEGNAAVYVDPETLMPYPRSLRNQMLYDLLQNGLITQEEYKSRSPFGFLRNVSYGEEAHWLRAQQINEIYLDRYREYLGMEALQVYDPQAGVPVLWTDEPRAHMRALMEILSDDSKPWPLREMLLSRYNVYEDLLKVKQAIFGDPTAGLPPSGGLDPVTGQQVTVPMEVIGAPAEIPRAPQTAPALPPAEQMKQEIAKQQQQAGQQPGGGGQLSSPAPEMSPSAPSQASGMQAQPLGSHGAVEAMATGEAQ
jgi:hypothetical protein